MKKLLIILMIAVSSLAFAGCSKGEGTPVETINIGVMPDVESIPFIIAEKNGYFEKEGVGVNIEHFKSAKDRDSALQSGKLDGVITDMLAVIFANEGGFDLKIAAKNDGDIKLLAGKNSGINSMNDLKGKSIGLSTNTIMEYSTDKMLEASQLEPEDVEKIAIPQLPTRLEMLQNGKIDAAILPEPLAGLAVKNGARVLVSTDQLANKAGAIAFTSKSLEKKPEAIKAIFRAYNEGVEYLEKDMTADDIDFLIEAQGFPPSIKDSLQLPQYTQAKMPDQKILTDVLAWMKAREFVKENYQFNDLVDEQVLR